MESYPLYSRCSVHVLLHGCPMVATTCLLMSYNVAKWKKCLKKKKKKKSVELLAQWLEHSESSEW